MHLPPPSPPIRGVLLWLLARLSAFKPLRRLILIKMRKDSGIADLPEVP
jgi:hypothetical protein